MRVEDLAWQPSIGVNTRHVSAADLSAPPRVSLRAWVLGSLGLWGAALPSCLLPETVYLPTPELGDAQSVLLTVEQEGRIDAFAWKVTSDMALRPPLAITASATLSLATFSESLAQLGVEAGRLPFPGEGVPLPSPQASWAASIDRDPFGTWQPAPEMSGALLALRIPSQEASLCTPLLSDKISLGDALFTFGLSTGPGVLLGTLDGRIALVDRQQVRWRTAPAVMSAGHRVDGVLWLGGGGAIWRGQVDEVVMGSGPLQAQLVRTATGAPELMAMWVQQDGERIIGFTPISLVEFRGGRWRTLESYEDERTRAYLAPWQGGVLGVREGDVSARQVGPDGAVSPVLLPTAGTLSTMAPYGDRIAIGTRLGELLLSDEGRWVANQVSLETAEIQSVARIPSGALMGLYNGLVLRWFDGGESCELEPLGSTQSDLSAAWTIEDPDRGPTVVLSSLRDQDVGFVLFVSPTP